MSLIRDAPLGQVIRWMTGNRVLQYQEERADFVLPEEYRNLDAIPVKTSNPATPSSKSLNETEDEKLREEIEDPPPPLERTEAEAPDEADLEKAETRQSKTGSGIAPVRTKEGYILVDYYSPEDPENPLNWNFTRKLFATGMICSYTLAVYMASSIITPSFPGIMQQFGATETEVYLLLALYVLMYGWGSLPAASLSELPSIGRNPPYMVTMFLFVMMSVALPLVQNYPALAVLRFLQGAFGAPCLATGGASMADIWPLPVLPYGIVAWAVAATAGPALGPLIAGYSVTAENWRWSFWEILWLAGPVFILMFCLLPETFTPNLLLRKAQRLRKLTGNQQFKSQSELDQAKTTAKAVAVQAFVRPFVVNALDPVVLFTTAYISLIYATYYSFFTSFEIVFNEYHFDAGSIGLAFLSIAIGVAVSVAIYVSFLEFYINPRMRKYGFGEPEERLTLGVICSFLLPIGLFIFGWTGNGVIPWIVPLVGIFIFVVGVFIIVQLVFSYLPMVYDYRYVASIFAANNAARSSMAFAAILYSGPMFAGIGVGGGCSLLAGLACVCCVGMVILRIYGKALRGRSRYTVKYG